MITTCLNCGGLRAGPGEMFGGRACECRLARLPGCALESEHLWKMVESAYMSDNVPAWVAKAMLTDLKLLKEAYTQISQEHNKKVSDGLGNAAPTTP